MFETPSSSSAVARRHREGPLAVHQVAYPQGLAAQGMARGTILRCALCVVPWAQG